MGDHPVAPDGSRPASEAELSSWFSSEEASAPVPTARATSESVSARPVVRSEAVAGGEREFAALLGEFRRTAVLLALGLSGSGEGMPLTVEWGGVRWILAFSDEAALARFAVARGEGGREWAYRRVLGARLLDVAVPAVGVACGVALDAADGEDGVLFPPVTGIVPAASAVDVESDGAEGEGTR